ncbi:MAG: hypothetical protein ACLQGP_25260 [Isosphaeraceae bacterium]
MNRSDDRDSLPLAPGREPWSAARKFQFSLDFLSAFVVEGSGEKRPESGIGALMELQNRAILTVLGEYTIDCRRVGDHDNLSV